MYICCAAKYCIKTIFLSLYETYLQFMTETLFDHLEKSLEVELAYSPPPLQAFHFSFLDENVHVFVLVERDSSTQEEEGEGSLHQTCSSDMQG